MTATGRGEPGPLDRFSPATRAWFSAAFAEPTGAQTAAWAAVERGEHTLVVAPTGSGKTLAAFMWSLDALAGQPPPADPERRCRVVYVSPLKALAVDIQRNLRAPLAGIGQAAHRLGLPAPDVSVSVRSGDTTAADRRRFATRPSDILITTPESLFLLLTSRAREALRGVRTVIVDEVHAIVGTKRGAHLALSLERLDALLPDPAQRIGLSATVRPVEEVAAFLGGSRRATVVRPPYDKRFDLRIVVPVEDMAAPGATVAGVTAPGAPVPGPATPGPATLAPATLGPQSSGPTDPGAGPEQAASIWPHVEERVLDLIEAHRSTIVFANSRRLAERLCGRLNRLAAQRRAGEAAAYQDPAGDAAETVPAETVPAETVPAEMTPAEMVIARAHHGSVSKEERAAIEEALKRGTLPAVVATSSLELGIDMGAVDLVVQVESPPSVAGGLQRVGRAGHQVGAVSRGVVFPKYRGDLVPAAVVAERMHRGEIERLRYPRNPLDVLAQQVVAMVALEEWPVEELYALVRRAAPFAELGRAVFDAVLDMLAGRYPSEEFAELRPRVVWDRVAGVLRGRPGAQRLAVTSGGTIPDRGLFGVFLAADSQRRPSRVGELDEEMVYESRVGDVFVLGASSWRIEDITHDRVLVSPAPGVPGKLPFWHGDAPGRPAELGRSLGAFARELSRLAPGAARDRARAAGLDEPAADNLVRYLAEQREATGYVPDDRLLVVERFRDELGDWRVVLHSPYGGRVHAPWALAIAARLRERHGLDVQALHTDDGIVLRLPDIDDTPPGEITAIAAEEIEQLVTAELGGSALFAARFRECAARALLLPRRRPGARMPLWQQRQRSAQLLAVASRYASFPIVLETVRECLQDVFDLPGLVELLRDIEARRVRVVEVETAQPSPFARALLFHYIGAFMYEGDAPLAERRAQALTLDSALLAELMGGAGADLRELLDPEVVAEADAQLQRLTPDRHARGVEGVADLLRELGPLTTAEAVRRGATPVWLAELETERRAIRVRVAGSEHWAPIEDAGRLRDALGIPLPVGIPEAFTEPVADPLGDLVGRYARTHGPFTTGDVAARLGIGVAVAGDTLRRLAASGRVVEGEFRPGGRGTEWCAGEVLRMLRRRSLAKLRKEVEPAPPRALAAFLPRWQHIGTGRPHGMDALVRAVEQVQGALVPASALETLVLPARVPGYSPALLDELTASGEVMWTGAGSLPGGDGWISLVPAAGSSAEAPVLLPAPVEIALTPVHEAVLDALEGGGALFFRTLADRVGARAVAAALPPPPDRDLVTALWDLVWAGRVTNDTLAPVRAVLGSGRATHRLRPRRGPALPARGGPPTVSGRWWLVPERAADPTRRAHALADVLLERYGIVTRGAVAAERVPGGFAGIYPVLRAYEEAGRCRRGYFVEGLGAAQFALPGAVDRMREAERELAARPGAPVPGSATDPRAMGTAAVGPTIRPGGAEAASAVVLASTDPANPYGAALPWPTRPGEGGAGHKPGRKAGALVVLVDGTLVIYVERGGRSLLSFTDDAAVLGPAVDALALAVREGALGRLTVERADGAAVHESTLGRALESAGFHPTPRGLRLRG